MLNKIILGLTLLVIGFEAITFGRIFFANNNNPVKKQEFAPSCKKIHEKTTLEAQKERAELESKLLPGEAFDKKYNQITNTNKSARYRWIILYPNHWKLYRIKRLDQHLYYDLKFVDGESFFYLREIIIIGGNPIIVSTNQWHGLRQDCTQFFINSNKSELYLCPGNFVDCVGKISSNNVGNAINSYYHSFISANDTLQKNETLIYDLFIPSINFERPDYEGGLREYTFGDNFYSNDNQFLTEMEKIYVSLYGNR